MTCHILRVYARKSLTVSLHRGAKTRPRTRLRGVTTVLPPAERITFANTAAALSGAAATNLTRYE